MAILVVESEGSPVRYVQLPDGVLRIGRDPSCELVLGSQFVSRQHAELRASDGSTFQLVDLGSSNGTSLNGQRIQANTPYDLKDGDTFRIEEFLLGFAAGDDKDRTLVRIKRPADELFVDTEAMEVWIGDNKLALRQARVLKLLSYLYANSGKVCSEEELGNHIWASDQPFTPGVPLFDSSSLHQLIYLARRAIEQTPSKPQYLINVPGLGYRLNKRPASGI